MTRRRGERLIGLISDTHGLVRPEALLALRGSELIIHAGDVGGPEVLQALRSVAPVVAVRGNNDRGRWADRLKDTEIVEVGGVRICVLHRVGDLDRDPADARFRAVICGHSHRPSVRRIRGVLYVNPGSAGPRRFSLPIAVGRLRVGRDVLTATIRELAVPATRPPEVCGGVPRGHGAGVREGPRRARPPRPRPPARRWRVRPRSGRQ